MYACCQSTGRYLFRCLFGIFNQARLLLVYWIPRDVVQCTLKHLIDNRNNYLISINVLEFSQLLLNTVQHSQLSWVGTTLMTNIKYCWTWWVIFWHMHGQIILAKIWGLEKLANLFTTSWWIYLWVSTPSGSAHMTILLHMIYPASKGWMRHILKNYPLTTLHSNINIHSCKTTVSFSLLPTCSQRYKGSGCTGSWQVSSKYRNWNK